MKPQNPLAFPRAAFYHEDQPIDGDNAAQQGMTLRDYFAASALQGMMVNGFMPYGFYKGPYSEERPYPFAQVAYQFADKMLEARRALPS